MKYGIAVFLTEQAVHPGMLGKLVEERGFESLFVTEHTHIPASSRTPYPPGGELPPEYSRTYDPFVALTAAAAATTRLRIATGIKPDRAAVDPLVGAGVDRIVFMVPSETRDKVLPLLDAYAAVTR